MQLTQGEHLHSLSGAANSASQSSQVWIFISIFSWYLRLWSLWWYRLAKRPKLLLYPNNYGAKCETVNYLITRESSIRCSSGYPDVSLLRCSSSGGHRGVPKIATKQSPQRVLGLAQCALLIWEVSRRYPSDGLRAPLGEQGQCPYFQPLQKDDLFWFLMHKHNSFPSGLSTDH